MKTENLSVSEGLFDNRSLDIEGREIYDMLVREGYLPSTGKVDKKLMNILMGVLASGAMLTACAPGEGNTTKKPAETPLPPTKAAEYTPTRVPTATETATLVPTATPEPTATFTMTPTATQTELPTPTETPENINYREVIEGESYGVSMRVVIETDKSLDPSIKEISLNESFVNSKGQSPKEAFLEMTAMAIYRTWLSNGTESGKGPTERIDFEAFMAMWSEAQKTGDENLWKQLQLTIKPDDQDKEGFVAKKVLVLPMKSGETIPGYENLTTITYRPVNRNKVRGIDFKMQYDDYEIGYGLDFVNGNLTYYGLMRVDAPSNYYKRTVVQTLSLVGHVLSGRTGLMDDGDKTMVAYIYNKNGSLALKYK